MKINRNIELEQLREIARLEKEIKVADNKAKIFDQLSKLLENVQNIEKNTSEYSDERISMNNLLDDCFSIFEKDLAENTYINITEKFMYPKLEDVKYALVYYESIQDFEKCAILSKVINTRYKINLE